MSQYNASREEIRKFIWSSSFSVSTPQDKALVFISDSNDRVIIRDEDIRHIKLDSDAITVDDTSGGTTLKRLLESNKLNNVDRTRLHAEATAKFISNAKGNISVVFTENANSETFKRWHLPQIINNENITSINHIEKRVIAKEFELDKSFNKSESKDRITLVVQGKEEMAYLIGKKELNPESERRNAIEKAIKVVGGVRLQSTLEKYAIDINRFNRINYKSHSFNQKIEVMGGWKNLIVPKVKIWGQRLKLKGEYEYAEKIEKATREKLDDIGTELKSKDSLEKIAKNTNEILNARKQGMELSSEARNSLGVEVAKYIDLRKPVAVDPKDFQFNKKVWDVGPNTPGGRGPKRG